MISRTADVLRRWPTNVSLSRAVVVLAIFGFAPLFGWTLASALTVERFIAWVVFILVGGLAVIPLVVYWPVMTTFGLYAFLAASLDAFPLLPGGATLTKPVGILTGSALLAAGLIQRRLTRPPSASIWWGLLMLWATLSAIWAVNESLVFAKLTTALSLFFLYLVAVSFRPTRQEFYQVCAAVVLGGVFAAVLAYTFGLKELASGAAARGRLVIGDMNTNPNTLGLILLLPLGLAVAGFVGWRGTLQKVAATACTGLIGVGIFISMSRTAVVASAAMLLVFAYRIRARAQFVAVFAILLAVSSVMPSKFYDRINAMVSGEDDTGSGRTEIWKAGIDALGDFGLVGAGLNNFTEVYKLTVASAKGIAAHNMYLMIAVELGIPGVVLLLAAIAGGLFALWRLRRSGHHSITLAVCEAIAIGMLVSAMFGDRLWSKSFWLLWILLNWSVSVESREASVAPVAPSKV